jgi:hypothetical protein
MLYTEIGTLFTRDIVAADPSRAAVQCLQRFLRLIPGPAIEVSQTDAAALQSLKQISSAPFFFIILCAVPYTRSSQYIALVV